MFNKENYNKEVWEDVNNEVDGVDIGDMPISVREAYYESLNREIGSLHEEYC